MNVEVSPESFTLVDYSAEVIGDIVQEVGRAIGIDSRVTVRVEVDEKTPLGNSSLESIDPVVIWVESGALEDSKRPRQLSTMGTATVLGLLLARVRDRLDPAFGAPGEDSALSPAHFTAWEVYAAGRVVRLGYRAHDDRQRRLYHFRIRHGFSDVGDAVFDELWTRDGLCWSDITALSDRAAAAVAA
ncbi:MAG: hypothetical protein ACR2LQ_07545 [Acidimicrobiales bacterium]